MSFSKRVLLAAIGVGLAVNTSLVAQNESYAQFDISQFPGTKPANLSFDYPSDWEVIPGQADDTLVEIGRSLGDLSVVCVFAWIEPGGVIDPATRESAVSSQGLREAIPEGAVPLRSFPTSIDGHRGGTIDFVHESDSDGIQMRVHMRLNSFLGEDYLFQYGCGVRGLQEGDAQHQMAVFDRYSSVFERIQRSITVSKADAFNPSTYSEFSSADYPEIGGVNLSFRYPGNWDLVVERDEDLLLHVGSVVDSLTVRCMFFLHDTGFELNSDELRSPGENDQLASVLPDDAYLLSSAETSIDGRRAAMLEYHQNFEDSGTQRLMLLRMTTAYLGTHIFWTQCGVGGSMQDLDELSLVYARMTKNFDRVVASIKIDIPLPSEG